MGLFTSPGELPPVTAPHAIAPTITATTTITAIPKFRSRFPDSKTIEAYGTPVSMTLVNRLSESPADSPWSLIAGRTSRSRARHVVSSLCRSRSLAEHVPAPLGYASELFAFATCAPRWLPTRRTGTPAGRLRIVAALTDREASLP